MVVVVTKTLYMMILTVVRWGGCGGVSDQQSHSLTYKEDEPITPFKKNIAYLAHDDDGNSKQDASEDEKT